MKPKTLVWMADPAPTPKKHTAPSSSFSNSDPPETRIKSMSSGAPKEKKAIPKEQPTVISEKARLLLLQKQERALKTKANRKKKTLDNMAKVEECAKEHGLCEHYAHLVHFGQWTLKKAIKMQAKKEKLALSGDNPVSSQSAPIETNASPADPIL